MINVLVTSTSNGIGQSIIRSLLLKSKKYKIIGIDNQKISFGQFFCNKIYQLSFFNNLQKLLKIIRKENIDILIPGSEQEIIYISKYKNLIESKTNCKIIVSSLNTILITYDKIKTMKFLKENNFGHPKTTVNLFPLIIKPKCGSGSKNIYIAKNKKELKRINNFIINKSEYIYQEYLIPKNWMSKQQVGKAIDEYSIEVLVGKDNKILGSICNWREMKNGQPYIAIFKPYNRIRKYCENIVKKLDVLGPINIQLRDTKDGLKIFEINTRFSGSTISRSKNGFNGPDIMINNLLNKSIYKKDFKIKNYIIMRYKDEIIIKNG